MSRNLTPAEKEALIDNRNELHCQLSELQADLEDLTDEEIIEHRDIMLARIYKCLNLILETEEDNIE